MRERICLSVAAVFLLLAIVAEVCRSSQPKPKPTPAVTVPDMGDIWIGGPAPQQPWTITDKDWRGI